MMAKARGAQSKKQPSADVPALEESLFLSRYDLTKEDLAHARLEWSALEAIYKAHTDEVTRLGATANGVVDQLRLFPEVHSIKMRIKDPEHLCEKVVRKCRADQKLVINVENYTETVTDLIGIRALHLFKDEWRTIHDRVRGMWELGEDPIAYHRKGDSPELLQEFADAGCEVKQHESGYRSVHYLLRSSPTKNVQVVELQVRTLFEEGWSEIDHKIRYPYATEDHLLTEFLVIFNRLAGSADEMGTFIKLLAQELAVQRQAQLHARTELEQKEKTLKATIAKLKITQDRKDALEKQVDELSEARTSEGSVFPMTISNPSSSSVLSSILNAGSLMISAGQSPQCRSCGRSYTSSLMIADGGLCTSCMILGK